LTSLSKLRFTKLSLLFLFCLYGQFVLATTVAIVDTEVDYKHKNLASRIRFNNDLLNNFDDDFNRYIDDLYGWNILDNKRYIFPTELHQLFSKDMHKYYILKAKKTLKTITEAEKKWFNEKSTDRPFQEKRRKFRSYSHGTHVTGLATVIPKAFRRLKFLKKDIHFLPIKYLGAGEGKFSTPPEFRPTKSSSPKTRTTHINKFLQDQIGWQQEKLRASFDYATLSAEVINCSFGKSYKSVRAFIRRIYKTQFKKIPSKEVIESNTQSYLNSLVSETQKTIERYPNVLFVFSAGNSHLNNDLKPHYPSNIRALNSVSVGASSKDSHLTYFSNYGKKTVDILAPGIAVVSSVPNNSFLPMNGTSQSAPYISNLAIITISILKQWDLEYNVEKVKELIFQTSDNHAFLSDVVKTSGIANPYRLLKALEYHRNNELKKAIQLAYKAIPVDFVAPPSQLKSDIFEIEDPLPSAF
jgi:cell wall-associated protease